MLKLILIPVIAVISAQIIKFFIDASKEKLSWKNLFSYGGMPSSHSALVTSLATISAIDSGINSIEFAISFILAVIVIRDAAGFRYALNIHAKILNNLIKELPDKEEKNYPYLNERLGHTPLQVFAGLIYGIAISVILYYIL